MHEFKSGDMALVVGYNAAPTLMGKVVTLSERLEPGVLHKTPDGVMRRHRGSRPAWIVEGESVVSIHGYKGWAAVYEHNLMRLGDLFEFERHKSQEMPA